MILLNLNRKFYSKLASGFSEVYIESFTPVSGVKGIFLLLSNTTDLQKDMLI